MNWERVIASLAQSETITLAEPCIESSRPVRGRRLRRPLVHRPDGRRSQRAPMSTFRNSSRLLKGSIVLLDTETSAVRGFALLHSTGTLTPSLQLGLAPMEADQ
jgi:hypothetical protein